MKNLKASILLTLLVFSVSSFSSLDNLNSKLPVEIEDAEPMEAGTWNAQYLSEFKQAEGEEGQWRLAPEIRTGLEKGFQATLRTPFLPGPNNDRSGSGDIEAELQYLLFESEAFNIGLSVMGIAPTGEGSQGIDSEFKVAVSRDLGSKSHRLHVNVAHDYNAKPRADNNEQLNYLLSSLGYSALLHDRVLLIVDVVHNQQKDSVKDENYGEVGLRYQLSRRFIAGLGLSAGEEIFLIRQGLQYDF
ncbi:MAG TPA: hypothetical protein VNJ01_11340 [Bacteriovoracaceae bacterium]|nr:hypothetical protein [Bacteriovoracaceae bacterium]